MPLSKEDQRLLDELLSGDPKGIFYQKYEKDFRSAAWKFTKNSTEVDDLAQELYLKIFKAAPKKPPEDNLKGWVNMIIKNLSLNYVKKLKRENSIQTNHNLINNYKEDPEDDLISKEISGKSAIKNLKSYSMELYRGVEFSLDYVYYIWDLKNKLNWGNVNFPAYAKSIGALHDAQKKIYAAFNFPQPGEIGSLFNEEWSRQIKLPDWNESKRQKWLKARELPLLKRLDFLIKNAPSEKARKIFKRTNIETDREFYLTLLGELGKLFEILGKRGKEVFHLFSNEEGIEYYKFVNYLPKIKCDPVYLIFLVWKRTFRRGKYTNREFIKQLFLELKEREKNTDKGRVLFYSIGEDFNINTIRKKVQRPAQDKNRKKMYEEIADYIYRKSFIELVPPGGSVWIARKEFERREKAKLMRNLERRKKEKLLARET